MKTLIINGSHRKGNTDIITNEVRKRLKNTDELFLRNLEIKMPDGCDACADALICPNIKDEFSQKIEPTLHNFDVFILATPTWCDNATPLTKIFIDRIVHWSHKDKMLLKKKKLAVITHGMADQKSWKYVINWVKSICTWQQCHFAGSLTLSSDAKVGKVKMEKKKIENFVGKITS